MAVEAIAFGFGALLVVTAILGGGFEIREIKMPQVGPIPRVASLVIGAVFIMIGLGIGRADPPQVLGTQTAAPQGVMAAPGSSAPAPAAGPATGGQEFGGINGRYTVTWTMNGMPHQGWIQTTGPRGTIRVHYANLRTGIEEGVDQDVVLQRAQDGTYFYQAMNPRFAGTSTPHPSYAPDAFRLAPGEGGWTITHACDDSGCAEVTTQPLP